MYIFSMLLYVGISEFGARMKREEPREPAAPDFPAELTTAETDQIGPESFPQNAP